MPYAKEFVDGVIYYGFNSLRPVTLFVQGPPSSSLLTHLLSLHNYFVRVSVLLAISVSDNKSEGSNQLNVMASFEDVFSVGSRESYVQVPDPSSALVLSLSSKVKVCHSGSASPHLTSRVTLDSTRCGGVQVWCLWFFAPLGCLVLILEWSLHLTTLV